MTRGVPKPGLSIDRHQMIGAELAWIHERLTKLGVEVANAYPVNSKTSRLALRVTGPLDDLRSVLEDEMFREHAGRDLMGCDDPPGVSTRTYYPHRHDLPATGA